MKLIRKYQNISFCVIAFIITIVLFLISLWRNPAGFNIVQFGPAIAAYIMAALSGVGFVRFSKDIFLPKPKARWLAASVVLAVILFWLGDSIERIAQNRQFPSFAPGPLFTMLFTFWGIVGNILGSFAEEIGWRGFMQPRVSKLYGNLKASIIIGIIWSLWHMGDYGEGLGFILFMVSSIGISIIITWLQENGDGSVWMAGVFHIFYNFAAKYFLSGAPDIGGMPLISRAATAAACIIPAIVLAMVSPVFKKRNEMSARGNV